jgi:hypothetical protein
MGCLPPELQSVWRTGNLFNWAQGRSESAGIYRQEVGGKNPTGKVANPANLAVHATMRGFWLLCLGFQ